MKHLDDFPYVSCLMREETRGGAEHNNNAEEVRCSRWSTVRGPLNITFAYYSFTSLPSRPEALFRIHGAEIAMLQVISNVSIFLYLVLFIRKAGKYRSSFLLSERFTWREEQLRVGLLGLLLDWLKDLCCLHNIYFLSLCRIKTIIYRNSSRSVLCFGR